MIAFNLVGTQKNSGTKTFNTNFFKEIVNFNHNEKIIIYVPKFYLSNQSLVSSDKIKIIVKSELFDNFFIRFIWLQFILPIELKIKNIKVLFSSSNYSPFLSKILKIKSVLFIHSVLPWLYFDLMPGNKIKNFFIKKIMEISIYTSNSIIVPSNFAKISFIQKLNIDPKKINVISLGADHISIKKHNNDKLLNFDYNQKYILSVISCVKYHNILNLLKSYKDFLNQTNYKIKFVLVITILDKKYYEILKEFVKNNFDKEKVIFLPNLENKYLSNIYKNCSLYIFTSYSETFGLTSLEAMHFGIPLLLSKTSSIYEINGDIPEYFDPDNISEIKNKLVKIFKSKSVSSHLNFDINKNNKHLKKYLWKNTFNDTYEILKKMIT
tara:strand:+ start:234 stop:1376 length:1143 start_codon:yes stop_codon:yes gene_type:complete